MNEWEDAILQCIDDLGGTASLTKIYERIGQYIYLTSDHLRIEPKYGNRPMYQHQLRSHISNLMEYSPPKLVRIQRGVYRLNP